MSDKACDLRLLTRRLLRQSQKLAAPIAALQAAFDTALAVANPPAAGREAVDDAPRVLFQAAARRL
ncbi:MAG: hypothetical protein ABL956_16570 [Hyphomonadaceae bacterium]